MLSAAPVLSSITAAASRCVSLACSTSALARGNKPPRLKLQFRSRQERRTGGALRSASVLMRWKSGINAFTLRYRLWCGSRFHASDAAVAASRQGRDVVVLARAFSEHAAQCRNTLVEIVLWDSRVRPDRLHQYHLCREPRLDAVPDTAKDERSLAGWEKACQCDRARCSASIVVLGHAREKLLESPFFSGWLEEFAQSLKPSSV